MQSQSLAARDLINIGVFTAVYFVIIFASGFIGIVGPWAMFLGFFIGALLGGPVLVLLSVRCAKVGTMALLGLLVAILMVLTGHFWGLLIVLPLLGLAFDLIVQAGSRGRLSAAVGYALFSLWYVVPLVPIFYSADAYFADIASSMGPEYAAGMRALFTPTIIVVFGAAIAAVAFLSGLFGAKLLTKHFTRAGLAA
ncbi:MAG: MptD family putative ECF transporter S component [Tessaracoccus sp.]